MRAAPWVAFIDLIAALTLGSLAVSDAVGWRGLLRGLVSVPAAAIRVPGWLVAPVLRGGAGSKSPASRSVLRGVATAAGLLLVFGLLFGWADAVFADLIGRVLPRLDVALPVRVLVGVAAVGFAAAAALVSARPPVATAASGARTRGERRRVEWVLPLAALDLLFAAFVAVRLTVLFGGSAHVLGTTGLTYAEYARQGFWQLLVVAALTLVVVGAAVRLVGRDRPADRTLLRVLLGFLCLLTLLVLASAVRRMDLYEQVYGLTRLRASVEASLYWLATIFALVLVAGAFRRAPWLPRGAVTLTGLALAAFALSNPDARIAESAVHLAQSGHPVDAGYLATLSADAVPALQRLPGGPADSIAATGRACTLAAVARRVAGPRGWADWNLAGDRARRALAAHPLPTGRRQASC